MHQWHTLLDFRWSQRLHGNGEAKSISRRDEWVDRSSKPPLSRTDPKPRALPVEHGRDVAHRDSQSEWEDAMMAYEEVKIQEVEAVHGPNWTQEQFDQMRNQ